VSFTHSGDQAPLVSEKNNIGKTKPKYNIGVHMTIRCKANKGKRKSMKKDESLINVRNLISDEWLTSPSINSVYSFCLLILYSRP
jgi:hypothetical protein